MHKITISKFEDNGEKIGRVRYGTKHCILSIIFAHNRKIITERGNYLK